MLLSASKIRATKRIGLLLASLSLLNACGGATSLDSTVASDGASSQLPLSSSGLNSQLNDPNGLVLSQPAGSFPPSSSPLSLTGSPALPAGTTPYSYLAGTYPQSSGSNTLYAALYAGQYVFSFGPSSSAYSNLFYNLTWTSSAVNPVTPCSATSGLLTGPVSICLTFTSPIPAVFQTGSQLPIVSLALNIQGSGINFTQNIYVMVLPGGQIQVAGTSPAVVITQQTRINGNNGAAVASPAVFTVQAVGPNGLPAQSIQSLSVMSGSATVSVSGTSNSAVITTLQPNAVSLQAEIIDSTGKPQTITTTVGVARELTFQYSQNGSNGVDPTYHAAFVCQNLSSTAPAEISVSAPGQPGTWVSLTAGHPYTSGNLSLVKVAGVKRGEVSLTVAAGVPVGTIQCNAQLIGGAGALRLNYGLPAF
jgi:hypothetical protein